MQDEPSLNFPRFQKSQYKKTFKGQGTVADLGSRERIPNIVFRAAGGEPAALAEFYTGFHLETNVLPRSVVSDMMQMLVIKHNVLPFDSLEAARMPAPALNGPARHRAPPISGSKTSAAPFMILSPRKD